MRRITPLLLTVLAACNAGYPAAPPPSNPLRILSVNDVYVLDTLADGRGGLARVATLRERLTAGGPTLFVLAGDVLSPSLLSKYYHGRQMVEALNAAKLDYATFGNHEFELPRDTLVARIAESKFRWVSTNCTEAGGRPFPGVLPFDTVRLGNRKIGLFGLTLRGDYRKYVACGDPDSAARWALDTLTALKADMIVGITHQTVADDWSLLAREGRIDLIVGGHEHEAHDSIASGRHVVKADANSRTAQAVTAWGRKDQWRFATRLEPIDARLPADTAVAAVVRAWNDSLARRLGPAVRVGTLTAPLDARDTPSRNGESPLGDLIADAMRAGTGADVALINGGTLRLDDVVPAGPLFSHTLESIFLFPDETRVVTARLTGSRLREVLEHGVGRAGSGGFPQLSGVRLAFDRTRPAGQRIAGALVRADGRAIGPTEELQVALPVYPACAGGDGYAVPEAAEACRSAEKAPRTVDLLIAYVRDRLGGTLQPGTDGRLKEIGRKAH